MKVSVLQEQADLFEISVLQQTAEPVPRDIEQLIAHPEPHSILIVGRILTDQHLPAIRRLAQSVSRSVTTLLVCPPFSDPDVGRYLDTPVSMRVVRRKPHAEVKITDKGLTHVVRGTLRIRSDHFIDTALGAAVVATDAADKPTLLRHQPTSRSGSIFVSTLQLLSYTALSNEQHRQDLLSALLQWRHEALMSTRRDVAKPVDDTTPERGALISVLLAVAAGRTVDVSRVHSVIQTYLGTPLPREEVIATLRYLKGEGVIVPASEQEPAAVSTEQLDEALDALGMDAYVRELRELIANQEEDRP